MKKPRGFAILFVGFILFFSACAYIDIRPMVDAGFAYLNAGDLGQAEAYFREALRRNRAQSQANLGLSLIAMFRGNQRLSSLSEQMLPAGISPSLTNFSSGIESRKAQFQKNLLSLVLKAKALRAKREGIDLLQIREMIQYLQSEIAEIVALLEEAKDCLERAMEATEPILIHPNRFDWNRNGILEPDTPLHFSRLGDDVPAWRVVGEVLRANRPVSPDESAARVFEPVGGDAWFDKELIDLILSGEAEELDLSTWDPVFDDNDIMTIGQTEMRWLYLLVTAELSVLEPFVIYQLDFGNALQGFLNTFIEISHEEGLEAAFAYAVGFLDPNRDGKITALEWRALFDEGFLAFRPEDQNGGVHAISNWKSAIVGFCETAIQMIQNEEMPFIQRLENPDQSNGSYFINETAVSDKIIAILEEVIACVSDPTQALTLFEAKDENSVRSRLEKTLEHKGLDSRFIEEIEVLAYPGVFFSSPETFADLKTFFPNLYYQWVELEFPYPELILFDDPTFGGLLQAKLNGHPWNGILYRIYLLLQKR